MKTKSLISVMSVSAMPIVALAEVPADIQDAGQSAAFGADKVSEATGSAGIFTLTAGPIPVTDRTLEGERKFLVLEDDYARKLGWHADAPGASKFARAPSKTFDDCQSAGGCKPDTDVGF